MLNENNVQDVQKKFNSNYLKKKEKESDRR